MGQAALASTYLLGSAAAVTPSDTVDLAKPTRALFLGAAGNVKVDMVVGGTGITFTGMAAGVIHFNLRIKRIYATGTTATGIVALS